VVTTRLRCTSRRDKRFLNELGLEPSRTLSTLHREVLDDLVATGSGTRLQRVVVDRRPGAGARALIEAGDRHAARQDLDRAMACYLIARAQARDHGEMSVAGQATDRIVRLSPRWPCPSASPGHHGGRSGSLQGRH
jgi:hypothetical protein